MLVAIEAARHFSLGVLQQPWNFLLLLRRLGASFLRDHFHYWVCSLVYVLLLLVYFLNLLGVFLDLG